MSKESVIIKNWPFEKGEKGKLIWIGEPFKQGSKWMVCTYFKGVRATRKIMLDWASIHFLSVDKYYTDGDLNNGKTIDSPDVIDINLDGIKGEYKERYWEVWGSGFKDKTKSKTFNFLRSGLLYTIPIIEVIRAVLAPDKFMLNRILEMDAFENYFTYEIKARKLDINFTSEYESKLLKSEKVNHLAWVLTNISVLRMFNSIGQAIWEKEELKYDFSLDRFNIRARVERKGRLVKILEIISLNKKRINAEEIDVYHPSLEESVSSNDTKKRKFVSNNAKGDRELETNADGSTKESDEINTFMINHEYETVPKIKKKKTGRKIIRNDEDKNTKTYVLNRNMVRTTADTGGENIISGLEFTNISEILEKGELQDFIEILKLLEGRNDIKSIKIIIGELPEGINGKRFSKLRDGITKRRYAIGEILMMSDRVFSLIEIEREDRALSMLLLEMYIKNEFNSIYSMLLFGLVNESGNWSKDKIDKIQASGITVNRIKHINKSRISKEIHIYKVICKQYK
ncbi:Tn7-like element transposition protein TnsE [Clostridium estertheticum]|uniref:Tn7-like element transposition protein TnsE n=1 Tax=Clostridium estertheticum TaxID=238834 RepID=UPI001C6F3C84|nr:Tn7-like element transposition protein TnsE [Clostridium estertheticum]MBW9150994.1 hypothetical protein [Clostridium estertheticum]WLC84295.1 hypothetical protein KTC97_00290 [Clostridium estertheticum]